MAAVGLKPSDRVSIVSGPAESQNLSAPQSPSDNKQILSEQKAKSTNNVNQTTEAKSAETPSTLGTDSQPDTDKAKGEIEDCLGCRVVGLGVGVAGATFTTYTVYTRNHLYTGKQRLAFIGQGLVLASGRSARSAVLLSFSLFFLSGKKSFPKSMFFSLSKVLILN